MSRQFNYAQTMQTNAAERRAYSSKKAMELDAWGKDYVFLVRVLTTPLPVGKFSMDAYINSVNHVEEDESWKKSDVTSFSFKGRIENSRNRPSPHKCLPDPSDLTLTPCERDLAKMMHTTFVADVGWEGDWPKEGDIAKVSLEPGDYSFNLQRATFTSLHIEGVGLTTDATVSAMEAHKKAAAKAQGPPHKPPPDFVEQKAKLYDNKGAVTDFTQKNNQKMKEVMHPEFVPYVKAFIYMMEHENPASPYAHGIKIQLVSAFRTPAYQDKMLAKWNAWVGTGDRKNPEFPDKNPNYAAKPAKGGTSNHNWGVAVDFRTWLPLDSALRNEHGIKTGHKKGQLPSNAPIDVFRSIGVEAVATMVGLRWGGTFGGNYDPVHVDLELLPATKVAIIDAMGGTESVTTAIANISKVRLQTA